MAEVVLGVASSHTPQLSTSADYWKEHGARDRRNTRLLGSDGCYRTYDELLAAADPALAVELEPSVWHSKFDRAQAAIYSVGLDAPRPGQVVRGDNASDSNSPVMAEASPLHLR